MSYTVKEEHGLDGVYVYISATSWSHLAEALKQFFEKYPSNEEDKTEARIMGPDGNGNILASALAKNNNRSFK